jgi:hypothetical protein
MACVERLSRRAWGTDDATILAALTEGGKVAFLAFALAPSRAGG